MLPNFIYEQVLKRVKFFGEIQRSKTPLQLPKVLSEDELGKLFLDINRHTFIEVQFCHSPAEKEQQSGAAVKNLLESAPEFDNFVSQSSL